MKFLGKKKVVLIEVSRVHQNRIVRWVVLESKFKCKRYCTFTSWFKSCVDRQVIEIDSTWKESPHVAVAFSLEVLSCLISPVPYLWHSGSYPLIIVFSLLSKICTLCLFWHLTSANQFSESKGRNINVLLCLPHHIHDVGSCLQQIWIAGFAGVWERNSREIITLKLAEWNIVRKKI